MLEVQRVKVVAASRWRRSIVGWGVALVAMFGLVGCSTEVEPVPRVGMTLQELALENARKCEGIYTYPQALIDGLSMQLIDELRCMDPHWLEYYTPCKDIGCIWAYGPQPLAARPEVLAALRTAAASKNDYITITAAYRDVAMQYFSRWFNENCNSSFNAAVPGNSNHQGGRAIDVQSYNYWRDTLLNHGFEHRIPSDKPHYELRLDSTFRAESDELRKLSVKAFQVLWNKNHPDDQIAEDGVYGPQTKVRLGSSPIEGFPIAGCAPDPCAADPCAEGCEPSACADFCSEHPCEAGCPTEGCVLDCEATPCAPECDETGCLDACELDPCGEGCDVRDCPGYCEDFPCDAGCDEAGCTSYCEPNPCAAGCDAAGCALYCSADPCAVGCDPSQCVPLCDGQPCPEPDPNPCRDDTCDEECVGDLCLNEPEEPGDEGPEEPEFPEEKPDTPSNPPPNALTGGKSGGCSAAQPLGESGALFVGMGLLGLILRRRR